MPKFGCPRLFLLRLCGSPPFSAIQPSFSTVPCIILDHLVPPMLPFRVFASAYPRSVYPESQRASVESPSGKVHPRQSPAPLSLRRSCISSLNPVVFERSNAPTISSRLATHHSSLATASCFQQFTNCLKFDYPVRIVVLSERSESKDLGASHFQQLATVKFSNPFALITIQIAGCMGSFFLRTKGMASTRRLSSSQRNSFRHHKLCLLAA